MFVRYHAEKIPSLQQVLEGRQKKLQKKKILSKTWIRVTITFVCFADNLHMDPRMILLLPPFPLFPHILFLTLLSQWNRFCFPRLSSNPLLHLVGSSPLCFSALYLRSWARPPEVSVAIVSIASDLTQREHTRLASLALVPIEQRSFLPPSASSRIQTRGPLDEVGSAFNCTHLSAGTVVASTDRLGLIAVQRV